MEYLNESTSMYDCESNSVIIKNTELSFWLKLVYELGHSYEYQLSQIFECETEEVLPELIDLFEKHFKISDNNTNSKLNHIINKLGLEIAYTKPKAHCKKRPFLRARKGIGPEILTIVRATTYTDKMKKTLVPSKVQNPSRNSINFRIVR